MKRCPKYEASDTPFVNTVRTAIDVDPLPVQRGRAARREEEREAAAAAVDGAVLPTKGSTATTPLHTPKHPWNVRASAAYYRKHGRFNERSRS